MSNEYVSASAKFLSESYARDNAGSKEFQEENTAYLVGIYEATKELLTDIISESEEIDYELSEEIADELIYNEEVFDYIDDLINEEILSEDVYIVPFSSFSVYLEETQNICRENILSESLYEETLDEGIASLLAKGAGALAKGLGKVASSGGFRGVAKAGASKAGQELAGAGRSVAGKAIQGVGYGIERSRQGAQATAGVARNIAGRTAQGVGYGVEKAKQGVSAARNVLGGLAKSGMETLGKIRQAGAEKIKQGQQLASDIKKGIEVRQRAGNIQNIRNVRAAQREQEVAQRAKNIQGIRSAKEKEAAQRMQTVQNRAARIQGIRDRKQLQQNVQQKLEPVTRNYQAGIEKARQDAAAASRERQVQQRARNIQNIRKSKPQSSI